MLVFSVCLFLFQLANASVLPLAGEALVRGSERSSSLIILALIIVPQILVALMAPWVGRRAQSWGRRPLLLIGFAALPIRALGFALVSDPLLLIGVQMLDGISATVLGVLTALVIADITTGTGRFNLAQGRRRNGFRNWRLNQHDAVGSRGREVWLRRGIFVRRRHRFGRDRVRSVCYARDKTTDRACRRRVAGRPVTNT